MAETTNRDLLVGMGEICGYLGLEKNKVLKLIRRSPDFPARKDGVWLSSRRALDEWSYETARKK